MIGVKNPEDALPIYGKLENQQRFNGAKCNSCTSYIQSPRNRTIPFRLPIDTVPEGIAWKLVDKCDESEIILDPNILQVVCFDDGSKKLIYDGSPFDVEVPCGYYYLEFLIGDQVCFSELMCMGGECGLEEACLEVVECNEFNGCCPTDWPIDNNRPRIGSRRRNNTRWQVYALNTTTLTNIIANGGTNISWIYQLFDYSTGSQGALLSWQTGGGASNASARKNNVLNTVTAVSYVGSVSFDITCDGITTRVSLNYAGIRNQPTLISTSWNFDLLNTTCQEFTTDGYALKMAACEDFDYLPFTNFIDTWDGANWVPNAGDSLTILITDPPPFSTLIRRRLTTECSGEIEKVYDFTPNDLNCL